MNIGATGPFSYSGAPLWPYGTSADGRSRTAGPHGVEGSAAGSGGPDATRLMNAEHAKRCPTCESRQYVDGSSDPGVSFKVPTKIPEGSAATMVRAHEQEHVTRDAAEARQAGGKVISQSVSLQTSVCPDCGRQYVSGGRTRTVMSLPVDGPTPSQPSTSRFGRRDALGSSLDVRL